MSLADTDQLILCTTPLTIANVNYILRKHLDGIEALNALRPLLSIIEILKINEEIVLKAIESGFSDFEDGLQYHAALSAGVDIFCTRNVSDYKSSTIPVMSPGEILAIPTNP